MEPEKELKSVSDLDEVAAEIIEYWNLHADPSENQVIKNYKKYSYSLYLRVMEKDYLISQKLKPEFQKYIIHIIKEEGY